MKREDIIKLGDKNDSVLHKVCEPIEERDIDIDNSVLQEMLERVKENKKIAVGLSLPQVGVLKRGFVVCRDKTRQTFINPVITYKSDMGSVETEFCLSEPMLIRKLKRSEIVVVKFIDEFGRTVERKYSGFVARIIQHEMDHLDGVLLNDKKDYVEDNDA